jgi:putative peptidoglycan lipid II flippase
VTDGLYSSANSRGLPPSAEVVLGPASASVPGAPLLDQESLPPQEIPADPPRGGGSLARSSAIMAAGTLASRVSGFLRSTLLIAALGTSALGDVFNTANTIPNIVYDVLIGGVLTAAHVPLLIRARNRSEKYGEEFEQRLFTVLLGALAAITLVAMAAATLLINLYASKFTPTQHRLAVTFLLFFLPQIFFYGFAAVAGASLNSRNKFGAPMWTPVLNNLVVIVVLVAFMATTHGPLDETTISNGKVTFLGIGVTAGVAAQAFGLIPSMRKLGFNFRPRFDFRRAELTQMWGMASWTLLYVVAQQIALVFYTRLANAAGARGKALHLDHGIGLTPWNTAYAFFQLPYAVVAISIITAILPRMTQSAAEGRFDRLAAELREGVRLSMSLMLPGVALLFGAASEIAFVVFAHGETNAAGAEVIAQVLRVFAIALTPFTVLQLLQRGFYALADTRTPALIAIFSTATGAISAVTLSKVLDTQHVIMGIAASQGISWTVGCVVSVVLLRRRIGPLGGREILGVIGKAGACALAALIVAELLHVFLGSCAHSSFFMSALVLILQGVLGGGAFLLFATVLRVPEVNQVIGMLRRKLGR